MENTYMKNASLVAAYVGFFGLLAFAVYVTESAAPLFTILIMPSFDILKEKTRVEDSQERSNG